MLKVRAMSDRDPQVLFQQGIELFNAQDFFVCHEVLEEIWTHSQQPDRWFLQALIHFAVGFHHHRRGNRNGAMRQLRKGLRKIHGYLPEWDGVRTSDIEQEVRLRLRQLEAGGTFPSYPRIEQIAPWAGLRSPRRT